MNGALKRVSKNLRTPGMLLVIRAVKNERFEGIEIGETVLVDTFEVQR